MSDPTAPTTALEFNRLGEEEMADRARALRRLLQARRTVRDFSAEPAPREVIAQCLLTAGSAPSGANRQPWHFAVVSDPDLKRRIREGAEAEEREFYAGRAPKDWLDALAPLGTDADKPFLETAPFLIVIFAEKYQVDGDGAKRKNYYVTESAGIAAGFLIAALHNAGLATLTHTPAPMRFLNDILGRPASERPLMILVTGYPKDGARVPAIARKGLGEIASFHGG